VKVAIPRNRIRGTCAFRISKNISKYPVDALLHHTIIMGKQGDKWLKPSLIEASKYKY
jgi:hypothetical protein